MAYIVLMRKNFWGALLHVFHFAEFKHGGSYNNEFGSVCTFKVVSTRTCTFERKLMLIVTFTTLEPFNEHNTIKIHI